MNADTVRWTGTMLKGWREAEGLSQSQAAAILGYADRTAYRNAEQGKCQSNGYIREAVQRLAEQYSARRHGKKTDSRPRKAAIGRSPRAATAAVESPQQSPDAYFEADKALIDAVSCYADAIADRIAAAKAKEPAPPQIAAVNSAADRLTAISSAGGYSPTAASEARRIHRWAEAAMDALYMMRQAERRTELVMRQVRETETTSAELLGFDPLVASVRSRGDGIELELYSHPGVVGALTTGGGGSSHQLIIYDEDDVLGTANEPDTNRLPRRRRK